MAVDKIGDWEFKPDTVQTPVARKMIEECFFVKGFAYWEASYRGEFEVVAAELLEAERECERFTMFPRDSLLVIVRNDKCDLFCLTPGEQGKHDAIVAIKRKPTNSGEIK